MKRVVMILGLILFGMNLSLWVHGVIGSDDIISAYPDIPSGLRNTSTIDQNNLNLTDGDSNSLSDSTGGNFVTSTLEFIEAIPVLGALIRLFRFAFDFILNITFGITALALTLQIPIQYQVFVGAINFAIVSLGLLELTLTFTASRGGVK